MLDFNKLQFGLSPLAGVSDLAFRKICFENGADFAVTEMVSAKGLFYGNHKTEEIMETDPIEKNIGLQLFGNDPQIFEKVIVEIINERKDIDWIDLNMGCPAPKIFKNGEGSAMMLEPDLTAKVIRSMVKASKKPISVKFRLGVDDNHINYLEIGKIAEQEGAAFVTLHARTTKQMYSGHADWEAIARLKDFLSIPVVGNGDVNSVKSALYLIKQTDCDAVAIGRGAMGNPFLFEQLKYTKNHYFSHTKQMNEIRSYEDEMKDNNISNTRKLETIRYHYNLVQQQKGEHRAMMEMRKHIGWYIEGMIGSSKCKVLINKAESSEEVFSILNDFFKQ